MTRTNRLTLLALVAAALLVMTGPLLYTEPVKTVAPVPPTATLEHCVDLNTANGYQLEHLPGIGPTLAWRIAEHIAINGPFETVDDLAHVDGITAEAVDRLRHLVCEELSQ